MSDNPVPFSQSKYPALYSEGSPSLIEQNLLLNAISFNWKIKNVLMIQNLPIQRHLFKLEKRINLKSHNY